MQKLTDNVLLLGNGNFNYYIVGKKESILIECGTSAGVSIFANEWSQLKEKPEIKYILVMHSHFDHVCGIPMLKKLFPEAQVIASQVAQKILLLDKVKVALGKADEFIINTYAKEGLLPTRPDKIDINNLKVDLAVKEGDSLKSGDGLKIDVFEAPGHSPCSIAAYLSSDKVMFISDAAGYMTPDGLMSPVFFQDYDLYLQTIKRLSQFPTEVLGVGHGNVPLGANQVKDFYSQGLQAAEEAFNSIKEKLIQGQSEESITAELFNTYIKGALSYYPEDMMLGSMYLLVKNVKSRL
ncbi:MAG: MBL fold metallo-hydrolase [Syntrophomonadaceae bacterium]|nr:MBL fold metallo-hydrolase [Syntrophomonadaceae bacterium]MDD4549649.1 MBL fold metallo-hydrolase [Syntrophomonadaceae bacterium]